MIIGYNSKDNTFFINALTDEETGCVYKILLTTLSVIDDEINNEVVMDENSEELWYSRRVLCDVTQGLSRVKDIKEGLT